MKKRDQNDPLWRFLNLLVIAGLIIAFSWSNAQNFDETEANMIWQLLLFVGGYEALKYRFFSKNTETTGLDNDEDSSEDE